MPEALISRTTSRGPGAGSGKSRSSSLRSPRNTTPFMPCLSSVRAVLRPVALGDRDLHRPVALERLLAAHAVGHRGLRGRPDGAAAREHLGDALARAGRADTQARLDDARLVLRA